MNGELAEIVIAAADAALYQEKHRGRNQVVSTETIVPGVEAGSTHGANVVI